MAWMTAAAIIGTSLLSSNAAGEAADTQAASADRAAALQNEQYKQNREDQMPFLQAGVRALGKLEGATDYTPFGMAQFNADPGYAFRVSEGEKALNRSAAARGGLISGGALKAATRFGQEAGSQEYTNAFNRYQLERQARLGPLQSLAGVGQTTANTLGQAGAANAAAMGNYLTGGAAASAAGQVGQANAFGQGVSSYLNYNQGNNLINALNRNQTPTGYGTPVSNPYGYQDSQG